MKSDPKEILGYIDYGQDNIILKLLEEVESSDASNNNTQVMIDSLVDLINVRTLESQKYLGYYHLFLGYLYQKVDDHGNASQNLMRSLIELKGSHTNVAMVRWLYSITCAKMGQYSKAIGELQEALKDLKTDIELNVHYPQKQRDLRRLQVMINDEIESHKSSLTALPTPRAKSTDRTKPTPKNKPKFFSNVTRIFSRSNPPAHQPEPTPREGSTKIKSESVNISPSTGNSNKLHTIRLTIPIDINALNAVDISLDSEHIDSDISDKLRDSTER